MTNAIKTPTKALAKRIARSKSAEDFLNKIAEAIQVPDSRYEEAIGRYKSVRDWLYRNESSLKAYQPDVSLQGSFKMGTVIKPVSEDEEYDIDLVCVLDRDKDALTQKRLKSEMGRELEAYTSAHGMSAPESHRRCWRIHYADSAQFHLDVLPAIPDGEQRRVLNETLGIDAQLSQTAIAITDETHPNFAMISAMWPNSNPEGYAEWFYGRMRNVFNARRQVVALAENKQVAEIPSYKVKTPLQSSIQILKRHRDMTYTGEPDDKPISVIISTLAGHAYNQEETVAEALFNILTNMENFILRRNGIDWIPNPTDPRENFADKWQAYPKRREEFFSWLERAQSDFAAIAQMDNTALIAETMGPALGVHLVERALNDTPGLPASRRPGYLTRILNPSHRKAPRWELDLHRKVSITGYRLQLGLGSRKTPIISDGPALRKHIDLIFEATTNVPEPYEVYWQVVNTGKQASDAGQLRGGFDFSTAKLGKNIRKEQTGFRGSHSIECFIVKDDVCVARSGQFIVNIA